LSTELTSSGSVNITTKSGTNALHGGGFYYFRDQVLDAALPGGSANPFQRSQYGGYVGGPILKDKLFFFVDAERTKQDFVNPVLPGAPFTNLTGNFNSPFRDPQWIAPPLRASHGDCRPRLQWRALQILLPLLV